MSHKQSSILSPNGSEPVTQPEPEVVPKAVRRTFSAAYKLRIVEEADQCNEYGQIGAMLRREGLYSSQLATWRRQREAGMLQGMTPKKRGRKAHLDAKDVELAALRRENERLQKQLEQAELIIGAQKKLAEALEQTLTGSEDES
jgi:transposase-like protein